MVGFNKIFAFVECNDAMFSRHELRQELLYRKCHSFVKSDLVFLIHMQLAGGLNWCLGKECFTKHI